MSIQQQNLKTSDEIYNKISKSIPEAEWKIHAPIIDKINKLKKEKVLNSLTKQKNEVVNEKISVRDIDYYYSNVIARASKTMSECRNSLLKLKKTGTEG